MAMEDKIKAMEAGGDVKGLEAAKEEAGLSFDGNIERLASEAIARLSESATAAQESHKLSSSQVSRVEEMNGSIASVEANERETNAKIEQVQAETAAQIAEVKGESTSTVERPPVPPLPEKNVETGVVNSGEIIEDPKQKAFDEMRARFDEDAEKKTADPENPANKLSGVTDKTMKEVLIRSIQYGGKDISRFGVDQKQLEAALPDLYKKGVIDARTYSNYILANAYERNSLRIPEITQMFEGIPLNVINEIEGSNSQMGGVIDEWHEKTFAEIKTEQASPRRDDGKILNLLSNAGRFSQKEEVAGMVTETVNAYLKGGYNISRLRIEGGMYPATIGNLYEMGFPDEANRILEKGLSGGAIYSNDIFEYQKKGYITEEQAKAMLDKAGRL